MVIGVTVCKSGQVGNEAAIAEFVAGYVSKALFNKIIPKSKNMYKVLARKYRPADFLALVGQNTLVKTLSNAIKYNRLAHAFLLSGIRGIGKTTTARIIAKTINCESPIQGEVITPCGKCKNCQEFIAEKHPDVIEMDAASKTGVGDIREVIENTKYLPLLGKYKIYIIDEVHMLSTNAFNALLKTLEEPPAHVIFIFATTELRKIPITIISRCQRFDLRRLDINEMANHLLKICGLESVIIEDEALKLIASSSEGSVRDALSMLDMVISYANSMANGEITGDIARQVLGISDNTEIFELFGNIASGNANRAIGLLKKFYLSGIDPLSLFGDFLRVINLVTKSKIGYDLTGENLSSQDLDTLRDFSAKLDLHYLTILWQISNKSLNELKFASNLMLTAEMIMVRLCYLSNLPSPLQALKLEPSQPKIMPSSPSTGIVKSEIVVANVAEEKGLLPIPKNFVELTQLFLMNGEMILYNHLKENVNLISFEQGKLEIKKTNALPKDFAIIISKFLLEWTGRRWEIIFAETDGQESLNIQANKILQQEKEKAANDEVVRKILEDFPGAEITDVRV